MRRRSRGARVRAWLAAGVLLALWAVPGAEAGAGSGDGAGDGTDAARPLVLVLHSYHPGFTWTDAEQRGILDGLRKAAVDVELQVEYLDAKRHPGPEVRARFEDLVRTKLSGTRVAVVVATDNAALEVALDARPRLFPGAPVVYCGINGSPEAVVQGRAGVTGVLERWDPAGTLRAIARMQPAVRNLLVVHDQSDSGLGTRADLEAVLPELQGRFRFEDLPPEPLEATLERLARLPDGWAVLLMGYNVDAAGKVLDSRDTGSILASRSRAPIYTMDETRFGGGVVGGSLLTGERQGEVAAGMVARILAGTPADAIPVARDPVAALRFDHRALERFAIPDASLPPGSTVTNLPFSYYQRHPLRVWGLAAFVAALTVLSAWLAVSVLFRHRAEAALRASEESLRITLDSIGDGVIATDARGSVTRMNPTAEVLTGWTLAEARGRPLGEVFHAVQAGGAGAESPVTRALREGRPISMPEPASLQAREGARRDVADSAAPIRDRTGAVVGAVLVLRDVTAERRLQEQLRQSQRMEVVGQLAGGVAHDFNNILTVVLGTAQLLRERLPEASEDRELSEELLGAAQRASELTRQLLAFSRKGNMQMTPVSAHRIIDEVAGLLSRSIDKRIVIRQELGALPDTLLGDPALLQSAILNLAVNGRDAMPEGGVLTFATALVPGPPGASGDGPAGEHLSITVTDTGLGMDEAVRSRLFEPYFTTKAPGKGTGLGLASVYGCVKSHRGQVKVESAPGMGSIFRLLFPVLRTASGAAPEPADQVLHGQGRILVIDDEEIVRNTVARMLRTLGYEVEACGDGHEAVARFRSRPGEVDLVILDLVMPRISGRDVFRLLRAADPGVRVILASGFTEHRVTDELLAEGARAFIDKPIRLEELSRQVRAAIRGPGSP